MKNGERDKTGRFKHGASGNPGGRPKDEHGVRELARELGPRAIRKLEQLMTSKDERVALAACNAILDRGHGKAPSADACGSDDPLTVEIVKFGGNPYQPIRIPVAERDPIPGYESSGDGGR